MEAALFGVVMPNNGADAHSTAYGIAVVGAIYYVDHRYISLLPLFHDRLFLLA